MYKTTRVCKLCGKSFSPEFGRQVFCSPACRQRYYAQNKRLKKTAKQALLSVEQTKNALEGKTFLSVTEAAAYMGVTRPSIYARIKSGEIVPVRFGTRSQRIPIDQLTSNTKRTIQPNKGDFSSIISKDEALQRYEVSASWLLRKLKAEGIRPKIIKGKSYFPKKDLDRIFPPKVSYDPEIWYTLDELIASEGVTRKFITDKCWRKKIPTQRVGRTLLISKKEWNASHLFWGDIEENYMTVDQAKKHYRIGQTTFYDKVNANGVTGIRQGNSTYYKITHLDQLFKDKTPKIPYEIRQNYMRSGDALKHYHIGQKRFTEETKAAGVTKVRTEGNYVWYKKDELDSLFKKIKDHESH